MENNNKKPSIVIYEDGSVEHVAPIRAGLLRRACEAILRQIDEFILTPQRDREGGSIANDNP